MSKRSLLKTLGLAAVASVAPLGAAAALPVILANPTHSIAATAELSPQKIEVLKDSIVGPGVHRVYQRPLTGLEIRAVRKAGHAFPTNRQWRSRYVGDGIPSRHTKIIRFLSPLNVQKAA
jgi:hypothetical protein